MKKNFNRKTFSFLLAFSLLMTCIIGFTSHGGAETMTFQAVVFEILPDSGSVLVIDGGNLLENPGSGQGKYFLGYSKHPYLWVSINKNTKSPDGKSFDIHTLKPGNHIEFTANGLIATSNPPQYFLQPLQQIKILDRQAATSPGAIYKGLKVLDLDTFNHFVTASKPENPDKPYYVFKYNGKIQQLIKGDMLNVKLTGVRTDVNQLRVSYGSQIEITQRGTEIDTILRNYPHLVIASVNKNDQTFTVTDPTSKDPNAPFLQFKFTNNTIISIQDGDGPIASTTGYAPGTMSIDKLEVGKKVRVLGKGLDIKTQPPTSEAVQIDWVGERKISGGSNGNGQAPGSGSEDKGSTPPYNPGSAIGNTNGPDANQTVPQPALNNDAETTIEAHGSNSLGSNSSSSSEASGSSVGTSTSIQALFVLLIAAFMALLINMLSMFYKHL